MDEPRSTNLAQQTPPEAPHETTNGAPVPLISQRNEAPRVSTLVPVTGGCGGSDGLRRALVDGLRVLTATHRGEQHVGDVDDLDLFALRAMSNQPLQRLSRISPDPAGAWRRGDREVIRDLALLELSDCGLRPPQRTGGAPSATAP